MPATRESLQIPEARDRRPFVVVSGSFDNLQTADVRFLQEAARLGRVHVRLWSDRLVAYSSGRAPGFPEAERRFLVGSLRYVDRVTVVERSTSAVLPLGEMLPSAVLVRPGDHGAALAARCALLGIPYHVIGAPDLRGFPMPETEPDTLGRPRVLVTGCFDWLHSGHVEFFLECAAIGELYVVVGSDRNVEYLKGPGHPLRSEDERRYMVQAIRYVHRTLISSGHGLMDAEPEISVLQPQVYVVNEDGDQPEKRLFCESHGIDYRVLRRRPHRGLPRRTSTGLRGF